MDRTDVILSFFLLQNSRSSFSDLADKLGLSINAVHKRVQALKESGVIRAFTAKLSLSALKAIHILVFGDSETKLGEETNKKLQGNESTYWVGVDGGNYLYVGAYLHNLSELESYLAFAKKEAAMPNPTVGILPSGEPRVSNLETALRKLDYRIIYSLRKDSRKSIPEIAEELGVSSKTVRRRISEMVYDDLIELSMEWYPDKSNDIITMIHIDLKASADKNKTSSLLTSKYSSNIMFLWPFGNLPNLVLAMAWTNSMKELQDICQRLQDEEGLERVVPHVLYTGYIFDTWRDRLVVEKGAPVSHNT